MELRIAQSALEGLQAIQAYYKEQAVPSRCCQAVFHRFAAIKYVRLDVRT